MGGDLETRAREAAERALDLYIDCPRTLYWWHTSFLEIVRRECAAAMRAEAVRALEEHGMEIHAAAQAVVDAAKDCYAGWEEAGMGRKPTNLFAAVAALLALCNQPADAGGKTTT